jgi:hypothetical protein
MTACRLIAVAMFAFQGNAMMSYRARSSTSSNSVRRETPAPVPKAVAVFEQAHAKYEREAENMKNGIRGAAPGSSMNYYRSNIDNLEKSLKEARIAMKKVPEDSFARSKELNGKRIEVENPDNWYVTAALDIDLGR